MDLTNLHLPHGLRTSTFNIKLFAPSSTSLQKIIMMKFSGFMDILDEFNRTQFSNRPKKESQVAENKEVDHPPNEGDLVNDCQCRMCLDAGKFYLSVVSFLTKTLDTAPFKKTPGYRIPPPGELSVEYLNVCVGVTKLQEAKY
ncbi:uncharacterized protein LOC143916836 [Arctopsyche grandis]|uniref:uncharacterized protein LOC143916836 n=1 Tax=Arctopsyche grandis TaxID=121162 RepID=UPI00406DA135